MDENIENIVDNNLFNILSQDVKVPKSVTRSILQVQYKKSNGKSRTFFYMKKIAVAFSILIISMSIVVYAYKFFENYKSKTSIGYVNNSIEEAIQNGYIQNVDMNYVYSNDLGAKIEYIVFDDYNLNILFDFDIKNKNNISGEADIKDLIIYDENNNIIFCYNYRTYQKFCKKNNIKYKKNIIEQLTNGYGMQLIELSSENNKTLYTLRSTKGFPKSTKLYIQFNNINFDENTKINGNWKLELNLNKQFYERNGVDYNLETANNDLSLISAKVTNTLMRITYKLNNIDINKFENISMYIKDQLGNQYNVNNIEDAISVYNNQISATFPINIQNATKTMTLYILLDHEIYYSIILNQV